MAYRDVIGLLLGIVGRIIYVGISRRRSNRPDLFAFLEMLLAWYGVVAGIDFGQKVLRTSDAGLGDLKDERITRIIGGIAVV